MLMIKYRHETDQQLAVTERELTQRVRDVPQSHDSFITLLLKRLSFVSYTTLGSRDGILPGRGLSGWSRAVHGDWSSEINQTASATETSAGGARERDVGILEKTDRLSCSDGSPSSSSLV